MEGPCQGRVQLRSPTAPLFPDESQRFGYISFRGFQRLRRQQAGAIIAARKKIVEGAVGMVEMALEQLDSSGQVQLDEERKAAMVSNLLVVLCSDRHTQPVVNTGSLYT